NGSAFAGLNANTPFYNTAIGLVMLFGRYWLAVPVLALAGCAPRKNGRARGIARAQEARTAGPRHAGHPYTAVCRPADRDGDPGRRPDVRAGARAGTHCRTSHSRHGQVRSVPMATSDKACPLFDLPIVGQATIDS